MENLFIQLVDKQSVTRALEKSPLKLFLPQYSVASANKIFSWSLLCPRGIFQLKLPSDEQQPHQQRPVLCSAAIRDLASFKRRV